MSDQKQSQFIEVQTLTDSDYVPVFGQSSNRKISKPNLFDQIKDETQIFIYPTTEQLQAADLVADDTWPIYIRNAETEFRLYQITSLAPGVNDIALDNGLTATFREEYSDVGFVVGPSPSVDNAIALFDGVMGTQLKNGPVIGATGINLIQAPGVGDTSYIKINPDESVSLRNTSQIQTDLGIDQKVTGPASSANDAVAIFDGVTGKLLKIGDSIANYFSNFLVTLYGVFPRKVDTWAAIGSTSVVGAGQLFQLAQHTSGGLGGGTLIAKAGSVADDGGTQKNSATPGFYFERFKYTELTLEMFGAIGDGVTDDTAAFQLAVNKNLPIKKTPGTVKITAPITSSSNLVLYGDGDNCIIDASSVTGSALKVDGALTALPAIASVSAGALSVTFASAPGLVVGDIFVIYNPTNSSYSGFRTNYRAGEFCEVKNISGNTVTLKNALYAGYVGASVNNYKLSSGVVSISGIKIIGSNTPIEITKVIRPLVENVTTFNQSDNGVYFNKCYEPTGLNLTVTNKGTTLDDYGVVFGNCQHGKLSLSNIYARRHAVITGGDAEIGCVPCRDIRIFNSTLKNDIDSGVHCADFHGNTEDSSYEGCTIYGGASWQGKNTHFRNCTIYAMSIGCVQYAAEILGGSFSMVNCDLYSSVDPSTTSRGMVDVGGNTSVLTASTTSACTFSVKNCRLNGLNFINITSLMIVKVTGSTVPVNIEFSDNTINVNDMGQALFASVPSGSTSPSYVVVDKNVGIASAKLLANLAAGFLSAPMRMQGCSGVTSTSTTNGVASKAVNIVFRYTYPKNPIVNVTKSGANYNGNRVGIALVNSATTTGANIGIYTDDATTFNVSSAFDLNWTATINEV